MAGRSLDYRVRSGIRADVVNNFDVGGVAGLSQAPTFTQRKRYDTLEPFCYFRSVNSLELDKTKDTATRDYATVIEVVTSFDSEIGGPHLTDGIADEIVRIVTTTLPTVSGADVYIQTVESVLSAEFIREDKVYFQKNITVLTRAANITGTATTTDRPVQDPIFMFDGWTNNPTMNRLELHDSGRILPATTYASDNNGYDFVSVTYSLAQGSGGTAGAGSVVTVNETESVSIVSNIVYELESGTTTGDDTSMALDLGGAVFTDSGTRYRAVIFDTASIDSLNFGRPSSIRQNDRVSITIGTTDFLNLQVNNVGNVLADLPGGPSASIIITQQMRDAMAALGTVIGDHTYIAEDDFRVYAGATIPQTSGLVPMVTLNATTAFPRIKSIRYGTIPGTTLPDVTDLSLWTTGANVLDYGTVAPVGEVLNITIAAGSRAYIVYDDTEPDLTAITQAGFNNNILNDFTLVTADGYKMYLLNNPFVFDNSLNITLS